jgi:hypothetical protein
MTRDWIATASRTFGMVRSRSARPRQRRSSLRLENLEHRLSLSSFSVGGGSDVDLNLEILRPGYTAINRNVAIVGTYVCVEMLPGKHHGVELVSSKHIGVELVSGEHHGAEFVSGRHIGTNSGAGRK